MFALLRLWQNVRIRLICCLAYWDHEQLKNMDQDLINSRFCF